MLRLCKPAGDTQAHRSQLWLLGDPTAIWFICLSALLVLQEGLRLIHFLLRYFLLPCQLFEFLVLFLSIHSPNHVVLALVERNNC